jgi:hypothetical protein
LPFSARLLAPISSNPVLGLGRARSSPSVPSGQAFPLAPCMSWTDLDRARVHIHILIHIHRRPIMLVCVYFCAQYQPEQSCSSLVELPRMKHLRGQALRMYSSPPQIPRPRTLEPWASSQGTSQDVDTLKIETICRRREPPPW